MEKKERTMYAVEVEWKATLASGLVERTRTDQIILDWW